ncbi:MAG: FG-GAP-like repeat-containing protein [Planctomycetota bacterium]
MTKQCLLCLITSSLSLLFFLGCDKNDQAAPKSGPRSTVPDQSAHHTEETVQPLDDLEATRRLIDQDDLDAAESKLRVLLITQPDSNEVQVLAARLAIAQKRFEDAIETIQVLAQGDARTEGHDLFGEIAIRSVSALERKPMLAWVSIESFLKRHPERHDVRRALIEFLNDLGHRHRACQHADWLCVAGHAKHPQLMSIITRRTSFPLVGQEEDRTTKQSNELAAARRLFSEYRFSEASELLSPMIETGWPHPEYAALCGQMLALSQRFGQMPKWFATCPENAKRYPEYWSGLAVWLESLEQYEDATGAYLAAIELDPTYPDDYRRLAFCLKELGRKKDALLVEAKGKVVYATVAQSQMATQTQTGVASKYFDALSRSLNDLGRPFEFIAWRIYLGELGGGPMGFIQGLQQQRSRLAQVKDLAEMTLDDRRMGLETDRFPRPSDSVLQELVDQGTDPSENQFLSRGSDQASLVRFDDVAQERGLDFQYRNHLTPKLIDFRIHEAFGGGIAVIDYDLDGLPDLSLNQGGGDPPGKKSDQSNQFFRNVGNGFSEVSSPAGTTDHGYSTGIAAGDINQDGFPDLLVGALGRNRVFINRGDGTFSEGKLPAGTDLFTASVAIADVTGDHLPDLVETNYVDDPAIFDKRTRPAGDPPSGTSPLDYRAAPDRLFVCQANGDYQVRELEPSGRTPSASLGVVVTNTDGKLGNEIFVANDAMANRLWTPSTSSPLGFVETAVLAGVAIDHGRAATACMGIATGDFDGNGKVDFHVTNFWREFSSLYLQRDDGTYAELAPRYGLDAPTFMMLGFGTQSLDVNRDGILDLAILNGHIEDYSVLEHAFRMPAQLLLGDGRSFRKPELPPGDYFESDRLGRSLVRLDWDTDGRVDLVAGHLATPISLLENQSDSQGRFLQLELVGTTSERDAIGAELRVNFGDETTTSWVVAGDGYFCSNERFLDVTVGNAKTASLSVTWPDGSVEHWRNLETDRRYLLIQGQDAAMARGASEPTTGITDSNRR